MKWATKTHKIANINGLKVYTTSCNRLTECFRINIQLGNALNMIPCRKCVLKIQNVEEN